MSNLGPGPEFDAIRAVLQGAPISHPLLKVGAGDDCAMVGELAITTDVTVEDVHFRRGWLRPEEIGWRAAVAALSDLAAVGAEVIGLLASLVLSPRDSAESIMNGVTDALQPFGGALMGGDMSRGELLAIDVVAVGRAAAPLLRSHARVGQEVWVTGRLGGAAAAVAMLQAGQQPDGTARQRYARPSPRIREMLWLREHAAVGAAIDLSDGLYGDVAHIAAASSCGILIERDQVPVDAAAGANYQQAVSGGEDYEICFTAPAGATASVRKQFQDEFGLQLTQIGEVIGEAGVHERSDGVVAPVPVSGYQHFDAGRQ